MSKAHRRSSEAAKQDFISYPKSGSPWREPHVPGDPRSNSSPPRRPSIPGRAIAAFQAGLSQPGLEWCDPLACGGVAVPNGVRRHSPDDAVARSFTKLRMNGPRRVHKPVDKDDGLAESGCTGAPLLLI